LPPTLVGLAKKQGVELRQSYHRVGQSAFAKKADGRLGRNVLKGQLGDEMNAILCAAGHNLRKILNKLRLFYVQQIWLLERLFGMG
jgi:hypothetical protein